MTRNEALELTGMGVYELAQALNISHSAIYQWPKHQIPLSREYQIRDLVNGKKPLRSTADQIKNKESPHVSTP